MAKKAKTLQDFLQSDYWQSYEAYKLDNDLFIDDPDRAERIYEAAEYGSDGSTHAEHIQDWRDCLECAEQDGKINSRDYKAILREIDACEKWHEQNGSLNTEIG